MDQIEFSPCTYSTHTMIMLWCSRPNDWCGISSSLCIMWGLQSSYRRSDFNCEILLIANCKFFHNSQSKESQVKEYAMNITRNHTPSARQALDQSSACTFAHRARCLAVEIQISRRQYFKLTVNLQLSPTWRALVSHSDYKQSCRSIDHANSILIASLTACHTLPMPMGEGVACPLGNSQSLKSQSGLYIHHSQSFNYAFKTWPMVFTGQRCCLVSEPQYEVMNIIYYGWDFHAHMGGSIPPPTPTSLGALLLQCICPWKIFGPDKALPMCTLHSMYALLTIVTYMYIY